MKLQEYIDSRGGAEDAIKSQRLYVPQRMQELFGLAAHVDVSSARLYEHFNNGQVFTQDMADYLGLSEETTRNVVGASWASLADSSERCHPEANDPPMLRKLITAHLGANDIMNQSISEVDNVKAAELRAVWHSKYDDYTTKQREWDAVLDIVNDAILDKLDAPVFDESSDDDMYGLVYEATSMYDSSDESSDENVDPVADNCDYVVSEVSGEVHSSYYDSSPVAVCKTERDARMYIKRIYKKLWSTKGIGSERYIQDVHTTLMNPRLFTTTQLDPYSTRVDPHYIIEQVPRV